MKAIILYATFSGNTEEVAELIKETIIDSGHKAELYEIHDNSEVISLDPYDVIFFGTFSWDLGSTPDFVKDFIADIGYKPENIACFGTGDTQFGTEDHYCGAVKRIHKFYNSPWEPLFIEQSPRGSQEKSVIEWTRYILKDVRSKIVNA